MKNRNFLFALPLLFLALSCANKEFDSDSREVDRWLEVSNDNYTVTTVLDGFGDTEISEVLNQPAWVSKVEREEKLQGGSLVIAVTVSADPSLEDIRKARLVVKLKSGATANITVVQRAGLPVGFNAGESPSMNTDFEANWKKATDIKLVKSVLNINGRDEIVIVDTPLPWKLDDPGTKSNIPDYELQKMMLNIDDWELAFNTTGIRRSSCANLNYFGLYNTQTGALRVFYYWPADLIPESGANDHMWFATFKGTQAPYNSSQFAVPLNHKIEEGTPGYDAFERRAGTYYTSAYAKRIGDDRVIVPAEGWWAFDVSLATMRENSFFDNYQQISFGMQLFDTKSIIMESIIDGSLNGKIDGGVDLRALLPASTSAAGKWMPHIASGVSSFITNKFVLDWVWGGGDGFGGKPARAGGDDNAAAMRPRFAAGFGLISVAVGCLLNMAGNIGKEYGKESTPKEQTAALGKLNADVSLSLNARMTTTGLIKAQRSHAVPEVTIPLEYIKNLSSPTKAGADGLMGQGLWNISNDPVVYIVKDAYWANKAQATYYSRKEIDWYRAGQKMAEYDVATSPYQLGLRLISFFDPTSIGPLVINEKLFGKPTECRLVVGYGIYPDSQPGYTDWFREASSMEYNPLTLSTSKKDQKVSTGNVAGAAKAPFKVFKAPYNSAKFNMEFENNYSEFVAVRLSEQDVNGSAYQRRYYGNSLFYNNPDAGSATVDEVQYVSDPQIFLPYNEKRHVVTDPDIPDMIVSVNVLFRSQGPLEDEPTWKTYTLRYIPRIKFVNADEVAGIAAGIASATNGGQPDYVDYRSFETHNSIVQQYSGEISAQLAK